MTGQYMRRSLYLVLLAILILALPAPILAQGNTAQERPILSGSPRSLDTPHFRVHYTTGGEDAVPAPDADANGIPDYAEFVARTMEEVWRIEVDELGWSPPPPDADEGGDARYDVYLQDIYGSPTPSGDIAGYTDNFGGLIGDNPHTAVVEVRSAYSYLVLDHDYENGAGLGIGLTVEDYIRVTAAHEFHHAIQSGYDGDEPYNWLWEATASWMESEVYPQVVDNLSYLSAVFKSPDTCLVGPGGDRAENNLHWYGMWVFLQALDQTYGHEAVRALWERAITLDGYAAVDAALALYGDTLEAAVQRYAVRNLLRDYEREAAYPLLRLEGTIRTPGTWTPRDGVQSFGTDYVELILPGYSSIGITVSGADLDARVIGVAGGRAEEFALEGGVGMVDLRRYEHTYLLITGLAREGNTSSCQTTPYTVSVDPRSVFVGEPTAVYDAARFLPPQVEGLADPDTGQAAAPDPAALETPFDVPVPARTPEGYTLNAAYTLPAAAFGADAGAALPAGEVAVLEYGAPEGTFITVLQGAAAWPTLEEYVAARGPRVGETLTSYKGLPALLVQSEVWNSITFMFGDRLVIVEGSAPLNAVEVLVLGLIP